MRHYFSTPILRKSEVAPTSSQSSENEGAPGDKTEG
jgi:hypothetical protein